MSDINTALYSKLTGASTITAIVGTGTAARVYPGIAPQGTARPCIVYSRNGSEHEHSLSGHTGFANSDIQIIAIADTYLGAESLASAVRATLDGWTSTSTPAVQHSMIQSDSPDIVNIEGTDAPIHIVVQEYNIRHAV